MHYIVQNKDFWMATSEVPLSSTSRKYHINKVIIFYIACQSLGSVCWAMEAIILQHTCLEECTLQ